MTQILALASPDHNLEAKAVFRYLDVDNDDFLSIHKANERLNDFGLSDADIQRLFDTLDTNRDGKISWDEFVSGYRTTWRAVEKAAMDRFQKMKTIGRGAFGVVRLVKKKETGALLVMKKVDVTDISDKERGAAVQEITLLAMLRHPAIICYHEAFVHRGSLCVVMDYADGGDLAQKIEEHKTAETTIEDTQVLTWFVQICLALQMIHEHKVVHRDLKAGNIFLTAKGAIKLGDFGIARVLAGTCEMASTAVGTPYYLAPEIIEGKKYDQLADMWSLGVVLYELAALQLPFKASNMPALMLRIMQGQYDPLPGHCSAAVVKLVQQLLQLECEVRPSINELLQSAELKAHESAALFALDIHPLATQKG